MTPAGPGPARAVIGCVWGLVLATLCGACTTSREFDLVIRGGTVYDGSGGTPRIADVAIRGDRIASIGNLAGRGSGQVIDAAGKAVSPGFIDAVAQSGAALLGDGNAESHVRQGITSEVIGEDSPAFWPPHSPGAQALRRYGLTETWTGIRGYLGVLESRGTSVNVGTLVPLSGGDGATAGATIRRAVGDGALGVWAGRAADAPPNAELLTAIAREAAMLDVPVVTTLWTGLSLHEQTTAMARLSEETRVPVLIARFGAFSAPGWGPLAAAVRLVVDAEDRGVNVTVAASPYPARQPEARDDEMDVRAGMEMRRDMTFGTDTAAAAAGSTLGPLSRHPAGFGLFPRVLGRYVREGRAQDLAVAIRRMTAFPAGLFRLQQRGQIREGYYADIVVFDPVTVIDRATFENPAQYPVGIEYVIVNGVVTVGPQGHTGARAGRPMVRRVSGG